MKNNWPITLMVLGFVGLVACLVLPRLINYSDNVKVLIGIVENICIGVGSVGIGSYFARRK